MIRLFTVSAAVLLLISLAVPVAGGAIWEPEDFIFTAITSPYPGYLMEAEDYLGSGNVYRERCTEFSTRYNERLRAYVQAEAARLNEPVDMRSLAHPSAAQRAYIMSTGFHQEDPTAAGYFEKMALACDLAQRNYNKALELTKDDDYEMQAEIFDSGAGIYDTLGMTKEAEQVRDAGAVARAHAAATALFLPLFPLAAVAGLLGAVFLAGKRR